MYDLWAEVKFVLKTLATKAKGLDPDGIDLYFTLGAVKVEKKKDVNALTDAMDKTMPPDKDNGFKTNMATSLSHLFDNHISRVASERNGSNATIIVLTNAVWDDDSVAERIVEFANNLKKVMGRAITDRPVSIEFVQFGKDINAKKKLDRLDNDLKFQGIP